MIIRPVKILSVYLSLWNALKFVLLQCTNIYFDPNRFYTELKMTAADSYPGNAAHFVECYFNQILTWNQQRGRELFGAMTREILISNSQFFSLLKENSAKKSWQTLKICNRIFTWSYFHCKCCRETNWNKDLLKNQLCFFRRERIALTSSLLWVLILPYSYW